MSQTDPEWPAYRFINYDLKAYVDRRKSRARSLRGDAQNLICQAEQIEEECAELERSLERV